MSTFHKKFSLKDDPSVSADSFGPGSSTSVHSKRERAKQKLKQSAALADKKRSVWVGVLALADKKRSVWVVCLLRGGRLVSG